jgi:hypothetical protein
MDLAQDHGRASLDDRGFFRGDFGETVAELGHVIEGHPRHRRDPGWRNDVGGVEAPAEADFQHGQVDLGLAKGEECGQRGHLEERQIRGAVHDGVEQRHEHAVLDRLPGDVDTLRKTAQVRRRVEPDAASAGARHRRDERRDRAFAVGAGDVNGLEALLRITEAGAGGLHPLEAELLPTRNEPVQALERTFEIRHARSLPRWLSNVASTPRSSRRGTTASTIPCASKNSER